MKRYFLAIMCVLLCMSARSQVVRTWQYWFDNDFATHVTSTFTDSIMHADIDVGQLSEGIHTLQIHVRDTSMKWTAPQSYLFMKSPNTSSENVTYHCWFDYDFSSLQTDSIGNGYFLLDVSNLSEGMHTLNIMLKTGRYTAPESYMFMKVEQFQQDTIGMGNHFVYHCWFDNDYSTVQTDSLGSGNILLDVSSLSDGMHTVSVMLEGNSLIPPQSYMFMKVNAGGGAENAQYHCWFDQDRSTMQTGMVGGGNIILDVADLSDGVHTVNIMFDNGTLSAPQSYMFFKRPVGGVKVAKWEYWLNGNYDDRIVTVLDTPQIPFNLLGLIPVETQPIRSSCFKYDANDGEPVIYAYNEITMRFWSSDLRFVERRAMYVDEQVSQEVVAEEFERNTTKQMSSPTNNEIRWFKLDAIIGDSLTFRSDRACTMQLFSPSGEEVYSAQGPQSMSYNGCHAWEDGTYYLAVHDANGSYSKINVSYQYIHRYAILAYDVHKAGNGGCSTISMVGNGFNSLLKVCLVNSENDTIESVWIDHGNNSKTAVAFNLLGANVGMYDIVFKFFHENLTIENGLEVETAKDIYLTSTVSYPLNFANHGTSTYTYTITNNGNMSAYAVPLYAYIATQTTGGITHLEFDGLGLPSIIAGMDLDSLTENEKKELIEWADALGDDHNFYKFRTVDEETGDSIIVRSNFFPVNFAPYETKTLTLRLTADWSTLDVWLTVPSDTIAPTTLLPNRGMGEGYCCVKEKIECVFNLVCGALDIASLVPELPVGAAAAIADCICNIVSQMNSTFSDIYCQEDGPGDFYDNLKTALGYNSAVGMVTSCASNFVPLGKLYDIIDKLSSTIGFMTNGVGFIDCMTAFFSKKPNCPPGEPQGGKSTPRLPYDPNEIYGYTSESGSHYMMQEIQNVSYEIEFENDTTFATAAAHTIVVTDTLDGTRFDLSSFAAQSVTIGSEKMELHGEQSFIYTMDMRPDIDVVAQIQLEYDATTGIARWTMTSLDPMTMEPTTDPFQGLLPVNYFGNGVGTVDYTINLKQKFADGTDITNRACIVFDLEDPIMTPKWVNTVDAVLPTSHIDEVIPVADSLNFVFESSDNRSGIWYHTLYYRNDSTYSEWKIKKNNIIEKSYMMKLEDFLTTDYLVVAIDSAGNRESKVFDPEYTFKFDSYNYYTLVVSDPMECGTVTGSGTYIENSDIAIEALPSEGYHFEQWNDGDINNPRIVHLIQDTTFTAQMVINQYLVKVMSEDSIMGSVSGGGTYNHGSNVCVTATASPGYKFLYWVESDTIVSNNVAFGFQIKGDRSFMAVFAPGNAQSTMLSEGWNWYSTYIEVQGESGFEMLTTNLGSNASAIKSQTEFSMYYNDYGVWDGSLNTFDNHQMYMIQMSSARTLSISGGISDASTIEFTLQPGWNWISYPSNNESSLTDALVGFTPSNGDYMKSQTGFAMYYEGFGWDGSLVTLSPGCGFMYFNNSSSVNTLTYTIDDSKKSVGANINTDVNHWQPNIYGYQNNMNITAVVMLDNEELASEDYEIGAFCGDECRGSARLVYNENIGRFVMYMTVYGNVGDLLSFRLYDVQTESEYDGVVNYESLFSSNAVIGDIFNPYIIDFGMDGISENESSAISIYPNPTNGKLYVNAHNIRRINLFTVTGRTVIDKQCNTDTDVIDMSNMTNGIYIIKVVTENGVSIKNIIKN